ncbi:MAG: hypothetical protein NTV06_00040, partial [candidate division Zixibacteria bacterium]|nr:hypothetical protein [candidate division Zixibacteria bacterium]
MNRNSFLLGLFSIGGQVLLLRELVSSLNGDELFIGTALFGWLLSVAWGAYLEGKTKSKSKPRVLFAIGAVFLPLTIIGIRLLPLMVTRIVGEVIPFSSAAFISVISVLPVSIISGMLFTSITSKGHRPAASIIQVYLFEGLGAFIGGLATIMLVGNIFSTLGMALSLGIIVVIVNSFFYQGRRIILPAVAALICLVIIKYAIPPLDNYLDTVKYKSYRVKQSFDTPYGHQIILERDKAITLVSDNTVEATYPDLLTAENLLIPPLLYRPQGARILYIGRAELGIMQLADSVPGINLTALDAR